MPRPRGVVITPPFEVLPQGGIRVSGGITPPDLRKYLLYWDEIDYPDNNLISVAAGPDYDFLVQSKVARRTRVQFQGAWSSGSGEFFLIAQQSAFERHEKDAPGQWSLAQASSTPYFLNTKPSLAIECELWDMLPVPQPDVPLNDILEFKARRSDELLALRAYLDEMYVAVVAAADVPRAKTAQLDRLEAGLAAVDRSLSESGIRKTITSLRSFIAGEFVNITGTGLAAAAAAPLIPMSPLIAGLAGAGIAFAIKPVLSPKAPRGTHPLTYVSSVKKGF